MEIEVYNYADGSHLHTISGADNMVVNDEILEFESPFLNSYYYLENAEYHVNWCSQINDNTQVVLATLVPNTGRKVFISYGVELVQKRVNEIQSLISEIKEIGVDIPQSLLKELDLLTENLVISKE